MLSCVFLWQSLYSRKTVRCQFSLICICYVCFYSQLIRQHECEELITVAGIIECKYKQIRTEYFLALEISARNSTCFKLVAGTKDLQLHSLDIDQSTMSQIMIVTITLYRVFIFLTEYLLFCSVVVPHSIVTVYRHSETNT